MQQLNLTSTEHKDENAVLALAPFQCDGVTFLLQRKRALLADEQGLGKTAQGISAAAELKKYPVLVVTLASLKLNWAKEIKMWAGADAKVQVLASAKDEIDLTADWVVVNYDLVTKPAIYHQLKMRGFKVLIADEMHYLKNYKSKRTKLLISKRYGIAHKIEYAWFLSGTPITNRPIEFWPVLYTMAPDLLGKYVDYRKFAYRYCKGFDGPFGFTANGSCREAELNEKLKPFMLRRLKRDHLKDLPSKTYQIIPLEVDGVTKKVIKSENKILDFNSIRKTKLLGEDNKALDIGQFSEVRREMAMAKLEACLEHIQNLLTTVDKLVVYGYHTDVLRVLFERLASYGVVGISGSTSMVNRQRAVEEFQNNAAVRVFIGQIQAAGTGITLTAASDIVFVESTYVPGEIQQAVDRCHRMGQKDAVNAQFLVVSGSIEETMLTQATEKLKKINRVMGDAA